jgi:hypothetical protein
MEKRHCSAVGYTVTGDSLDSALHLGPSERLSAPHREGEQTPSSGSATGGRRVELTPSGRVLMADPTSTPMYVRAYVSRAALRGDE